MSSSNHSLRVALIGAGAIAQEAHLPAWRARPDAELTWLIDSRTETAEAAAERWGIPRWGTDYRAALVSDEVDTVDVCTPAFVHAEVTIAALRAGKHVLVEKPVAPTLEEAEAMGCAATESGRVLMVAENWLFASATRRVQALLADGVLGDPFLLYALHESGLRLEPDARADQGDRARLGYLFAAGIHSLNLARALMGEFAQLSAYATPARPAPDFQLPNETDMVIAARFEPGGIGSFHFTGRSRHVGPRRLGFRLFGTEGTVEFDVLAGYVKWAAKGAQTCIQDARPSLGYAEEIDHFVACVRSGIEPRTSIADQMKTLRVVYAAYESAMSGRPVTLAREAP